LKSGQRLAISPTHPDSFQPGSLLGYETPETKEPWDTKRATTESQWDSKASLAATAEMESQLKNGGFSPNWMVTVPMMVMVLM